MTVEYAPALTVEDISIHRVPANIETAAWTAVADNTWEVKDIVALLNTALATALKPSIETSRAVMLFGTLEFVNANEAAINNAKYADGETPDDDDTVQTFATAAAIGSEYERGIYIQTDDSGQIQFEVDDKANLSLVFHLTGYQYTNNSAE